MSSQPTLVIGGNTADAERAIAGLERKYDALEQKLKHTAARSRAAGQSTADAFSKKGVDGWTSSLGSAMTKLSGIATVGMAVKAVAAGIADQFTKVNEEVSRFWETQREAETKLQIQGGFTPEQVVGQLPEIKKALWSTPAVKTPEAIELQTQLSGAGFKAEDVKSGQALQTMLDLRAVTTSFGKGMEDPKESVLGMSQLIKGLGNTAPQASDIRRIGERVATLMAESDIQFKDLGQLAGEAATLKQFGLSESEQLGAFSWMRDVKGAEEGSTGLRIFTSRTATAGTDKGRTEALEQIGLKPEDVAIAKGGVTFDQAITRIQAGMEKLPEEAKNKFLVEMYGEKGQASAAIMLDKEGSEKIRARTKMAENAEADFQMRLEKFQTSRQAVMARPEIDKEFAMRKEAEKGMTWAEFKKFQEAAKHKEMAAQDTVTGRQGVAIRHWVGEFTTKRGEGVGMRPADFGAPDKQGINKIGEKQLEQIKRFDAERALAQPKAALEKPADEAFQQKRMLGGPDFNQGKDLLARPKADIEEAGRKVLEQRESAHEKRSAIIGGPEIKSKPDVSMEQLQEAKKQTEEMRKQNQLMEKNNALLEKKTQQPVIRKEFDRNGQAE